MEKGDLSEEEYNRRKQEVIAAQKKKNFSNIFVLCASLFLIIETMIILGILMVPLFAIFSHLIPRFNNSTAIGMAFAVTQMVFFVGGLILGFMLFRFVMNYIIRHYHLEDKLTESVKSHYLKKTKEEKEMELRR